MRKMRLIVEPQAQKALVNYGYNRPDENEGDDLVYIVFAQDIQGILEFLMERHLRFSVGLEQAA